MSVLGSECYLGKLFPEFLAKVYLLPWVLWVFPNKNNQHIKHKQFQIIQIIDKMFEEMQNSYIILKLNQNWNKVTLLLELTEKYSVCARKW